MAATTLAKGITSGLRAAMEKDPKVVLMGEDIGKLGGVFRVTEGLQKDFGEDRVIDTPLAEAGILGTAIGMALRGYRPVVEIQFDGFVYPAFDHIVSQVAKLRARSLGPRRDAARHPHPVRRRHRRGRAPQRVQRGLLRAHRRPARRRLLQPARRALDDPAGDRDRRPRRVLRAQAPLLGQGRGRRRPRRCARHRPGAARGHRRHAARLRPDGEDLPPGGPGRRGGGPHPRGRRPALALAARRATPILDSARRTGRVVVVHEASTFLGLGAEISALVTERAFYHLEAPVLRVGGYNVPYPPSRIEEEFLPDLDRVLDAVDRSLAH